MAKIFLVGMMGVGKSHWAAKWARKLNVPHYDLDEIIEKEQGIPITEIFSQKGEKAFREMESQALRQVGAGASFVMATGGGAPCEPGNMEFMNAAGITIWLDEPVEIITGRLRQGRDQRPLVRKLADHELKDYITSKLAERSPYYSQAKYRLSGKEISNKTLEQIINNDR